MRWVTLSEPLDAATLQAIGSLLDLPEAHVNTVWELVRRHRHGGYRIFHLQLRRRREIHLPSEALRELQSRFLQRILHTGPISPAAYAGVHGRSVLDVARKHLTNPGHILSLDIQEAYDSTSYKHVSQAVARRLRRELWILGLSRPEANKVIGTLAYCLTARRGDGPGRKLPLGAPTSVALFNLVCLELDGAICKYIAERAREVVYTRYVDDLVFSGHYEFRRTFEADITRLVRDRDYTINPAKTMRQPREQAVVCGLQWTGAGIEPSAAVRARLAERVQQHLSTLASSTTTERQRLRSIAALRSLNGLLRLYYERQKLTRPPELIFTVPELPGGSDLHQLDLLWH